MRKKTILQISLLIILIFTGDINWKVDWILFVISVILLSVASAGIGMLVAAFSNTLDNFAAIMNFVIFPVFFLSGSLYPVTNLPGVLGIIATLNPYTYGVDLLKHSINVPLGGIADFSVIQDLIVLITFSLIAFCVSSWRFSRDGASNIWFSSPRRK